MEKNELEKSFSIADFIEHNIDVDTSFLSSIFDNVPTCLVILNSLCEIVTCNKRTCTVFGCKNEREFVEHFHSLSPPLQLDGMNSEKKFLKITEKASTHGQFIFDWIHQTRDGEPFLTQITLIKTDRPDSNGGFYLIGFLLDLRYFMRQMEEERTALSRIKAIIDVSPLCVNLWDRNFNNTLCNQKVLDLFQLDTAEEYMKQLPLLSPEYQPNGQQSLALGRAHLSKAFDEGQHQFKWMHCTKEGEELPCEVTLAKLVLKNEIGGEQEFVAGYTRDLRPEFMRSGTTLPYENYFLDKISDKTLLSYVAMLADEWFFAMDVRTSHIHCFGKGVDRLGLDSQQMYTPGHFVQHGIVFAEDIVLYNRLIDNMKQGLETSIDIRFVLKDKTHRYHRPAFHTVYGDEDMPLFVVGKWVDVHEQKQIEMRSKVDLLTNCYNKISAESMIADILADKQDRQHTLFIIDIDNFKAINDNLGHYVGDTVLKDVAQRLKSVFRNQDIVARIGGDEFMVFAQDTPNRETIQDRAQRIVDAFRATYSSDFSDYSISGSVGIALFSKDGSNFQSLYQAADKALYQSKLLGKNQYTFYSDDFKDGTMRNLTKMENASRIAKTYFDVDLISDAFSLLYETQNKKSAFNTILQHVCTHYQAHRCYIFETPDQGQTYNNTYEWCAEGISAKMNSAQNTGKALYADLFQMANRDGVFYCNDMLQLKADGAYESMKTQGIQSFVHAQIRKNNIVTMFLGLDDCAAPRVWNEKEINSLMYIAKLISIFMLHE